MIGRIAFIALATAAMVGIARAGDEDTFPLGLPNAKLIYSVGKVDLVLLKTHPPSLLITAEGTASSSGWSHGQLSPRFYLVPPADGIWDFDFVASSPTGMVNPVLSPIKAQPYPWPFIPPDVLGVRVHAATNFVEALFAIKSPRAVPGTSPAEVYVDVAQPVIIDRQPVTTPKASVLSAKLSLHNPTRSDLEFTQPTPCAVVRWEIRAADGSLVQKEPDQICDDAEADLKLDAGQTITEPLSIVLDDDAYQSNTYTLQVSFWGIAAGADFKVEVVH